MLQPACLVNLQSTLLITQPSSRSRGINQNIFKTYDYILVFVGREYEALLLLKKALIEAQGEGIAPAGKGRIIHLGAYLSQAGKPVEIVDPPKKEGRLE